MWVNLSLKYGHGNYIDISPGMIVFMVFCMCDVLQVINIGNFVIFLAHILRIDRGSLNDRS